MAEVEQKKNQTSQVEHYQTFVVRCSLADEYAMGEKRTWRFYIESTSGARRRKILASLEDLMDYIECELEESESHPY